MHPDNFSTWTLQPLNWTRGIRFNVAAAFVALALICALSSTAFAQNQKNSKKSKDNPVQELQIGSLGGPALLTDTQTIDLVVSQMLAAWQIGDADLLHTFYSEDVLMVSGAWEPPLQGWPNYARAYQAQRARTQSARLDRTNTFTKVDGDTAMCTYQWTFAGEVDGAPSSAFGHTTLMLQKRAGKWLIILNHTSVAPAPERTVPTSALPQGSAGRMESAAVPR